MIGLNIHLKSFTLNPKIVNENDKIRVSVTTLPEQNKEAFITDAKQSSCVHHFFTVNISKKTELIVIVFRKKGLLESPIIASATIKSKDLPTSKGDKNTEMKTFKIYEPVRNDHKTRRIYGEMEIQFSITSAFPSFDKNQTKKQNNNQLTNRLMSNKINGYCKINNQIQKRNRSLFIDEYDWN